MSQNNLIQASSQASRFSEQDIGIDVKQVDISVAGKELLQGANLRLVQGRHYGLLGRNGVGKSILLNCIAAGKLFSPSLRESLRVMLIRQTLDIELPGDSPGATATASTSSAATADSHSDAGGAGGAAPWTALDELKRTPFGIDYTFSELERWRLLADQRSGVRGKAARDMVAQLEALSLQGDDPGSSDDPYYDHDEPDRLDEKVVLQTAKQLKVTEEMLRKPYGALSGGWRMRVQLAKALLHAPDLLLLDEPTNHLDISGIEWLQKVMKSKFADMTIVLVSHNRSFLDHVAEEMIVFRNKKLEYYTGNYTQLLQTLEEKEAFADRAQEAIDRKKAKMEASVRDNLKLAHKHGDDKRLKQVAAKKYKLEERLGFERNAKGHRFKLNRDRPGYHLTFLGDVERVEDEKTTSRLLFRIPTPALPRSGGGTLLTVEDVSFRRVSNGKVTFKLEKITFGVDAGQRIAILGANGQGKSTLLNLLADAWQPSQGQVQRKTTKVGYFEQNVVAALGQEDVSPLQRMVQRYPDVKETELWKHLGAFGLGSPQIATQALLSQLSGGQRVAYAFAELTFAAPSLLLLDEPNGHLDLDAIEALEDSLCTFEGGIVFVSHDISFIERVATDAFWLDGGKLRKMELEELAARA